MKSWKEYLQSFLAYEFAYSYQEMESFLDDEKVKVVFSFKGGGGAFDSDKNHKRQSVTAKRKKSQTPKLV